MALKGGGSLRFSITRIRVTSEPSASQTLAKQGVANEAARASDVQGVIQPGCTGRQLGVCPMLDEPTKCRANARECLDLEAEVLDPQERAGYLELADKWIKLALELERRRKLGQR